MKLAAAVSGSTAPVEAPVEVPIEVQDPEALDVTATDKPWIVIVWNDPVNLIVYVCYVLQKLFGYGRSKAMRLRCRSTTRARRSCRRGRARRRRPTSPASTPTASGRRWSTPRDLHDRDARVSRATGTHA